MTGISLLPSTEIVLPPPTRSPRANPRLRTLSCPTSSGLTTSRRSSAVSWTSSSLANGRRVGEAEEAGTQAESRVPLGRAQRSSLTLLGPFERDHRTRTRGHTLTFKGSPCWCSKGAFAVGGNPCDSSKVDRHDSRCASCSGQGRWKMRAL